MINSFIVSENVNRRHLSKSQRAMAVAKAFPKPQQGKKTSLEIKEVNAGMLSQARTVIRLASDLVDQVFAGTMTVDVAYKQAVLRKSDKEKQEAASEEGHWRLLSRARGAQAFAPRGGA